MRDYQESVTTGQTDAWTDAGQSDAYVLLCFAGDTIVLFPSKLFLNPLSLVGLDCFEDLQCFIIIFQSYRDLKVGEYPISEMEVARPWLEFAYSASQELNHYTTATPSNHLEFQL